MRKRISDETIYAAIYVVPRGELRRTLIGCLRQHRKVRRGRCRSGQKRGQIPNPTPIAARPAEVEARLVPGHWEDDILKGRANGSAVGSLVERTTRLVLLARMPGLDSRSVVQGFARKLQRIPQPLRKSMTYDQGREMARHELLSKKLRLDVYFADPHSPWQRGTNENTNGLLRQYLPKSADLAALSQRELNAIAIAAEQPPPTDLELDDAERSVGSSTEISQRCTWNLRPPPLKVRDASTPGHCQRGNGLYCLGSVWTDSHTGHSPIGTRMFRRARSKLRMPW
jgi:IS30 family transposase